MKKRKGLAIRGGEGKLNSRKISFIVATILVILFIFALIYQGGNEEGKERIGGLEPISLGPEVEMFIFSISDIIDQALESGEAEIAFSPSSEEEGQEGVEENDEDDKQKENFFPLQTFKKNSKLKTIKEIDDQIKNTNKEIEITVSGGRKAENKNIMGFFRFFEVLKENLGTIAGNVIYDEGDLPPAPRSPGPARQVMKPNHDSIKILSFLTGNAIIGVPDWSYDGSKEKEKDPFERRFEWDAKFIEESFDIRYFELSLKNNLKVEGAVNGVVYNRGYYLDEKEKKWAAFDFKGTKVGSMGWLRHEGAAKLTLQDATEEDYNIFLAYSCLKVKGEWDCNDGKWIIFVVETGETYYHGDIRDVPPMEYTEIEDLDITDIPSILKQLDVSVFEFQPKMEDIGLIAPQIDFEVEENNIQKLDFYVSNLGNSKLTGLTFELDVGERDLAEVVGADIPDSIGVGETVSASVSLLLKEKGKWEFHLFVMPNQEEVDTSDNAINFNIVVGERITEKYPSDPLDTGWNREIDYKIKEPYSDTPYAEESSLVIISGTDRIRTIFGGYYEGLSINPTMEVHLNPRIVEEALFSTPFIASIHIGGEMLTGDREVVEYYVVLTNQNNGKKYTTPVMQSQFKYDYNPKELIPDFEFCVDYTTEVVLVGRTSETIDIIEPERFNVCEFGKILIPFRTERLLKLDGNYVQIKGGFSSKHFKGVNIQYIVEFTDPKDLNKKYETPVINSKDGYAIFKIEDVFKWNGRFRWIDYRQGETFPAKIVLIDNPQASGDAEIKFGERDESLHFVWNEWDITASLKSELVLRDEKIKIGKNIRIDANAKISLRDESNLGVNPPWETKITGGYNYQFPRYYKGDYKLRQKISGETPFDFFIKDLNENKIIYEIKNGKSTNYGTIGLEYLDSLEPLPKFKNGHTYEFYYKVVGKNAHLFLPLKPIRVFYLDAFQFIVNNPLIRTRFMFMENHPASFYILGEENENYIPEISMIYVPKNLHYDESTYKFNKIDTSRREIKISELSMHSNFQYEPLIEKLKPSFHRLNMRIIPLGNEEISIKKEQFNCKLGRFNMICRRNSLGYNINYVDEVNKIMYQISLKDNSVIFLKKYRDNPKFYDAIIYDILSEIDRNPIVNFEIPYYVENSLKNFVGYSLIKQENSYAPPIEGHTGFETGKPYFSLEEKQRCLFNKGYGEIYGDYNIIQRTVKDYGFSNIILKIIKIRDSEVIASREFNTLRGAEAIEIVNQWVNSLNLINNEYYKIDIEAIDGSNNYFIKRNNEEQVNPGIYYYSQPFKYKNNYEKEVLEDNAEYIRKIPGLKSTILGPYDFVYDSQFPCVDKEWYGRFGSFILGYSLKFGGSGGSRRHVFPKISYYNNYFSKPEIGNRFMGFFSVNPPGVSEHYPGEKTTREEFRDNTIGDRGKFLESNRNYGFAVTEFDNIYDYYEHAPINRNAYDAELSGVVCGSNKIRTLEGAHLILICKWSDIDELKVYDLSISQYFPGKTRDDMSNLPDDVLNDFKDNYAEVVLKKYLDWYPPTPLLDTNFYS